LSVNIRLKLHIYDHTISSIISSIIIIFMDIKYFCKVYGRETNRYIVRWK